VKQKTKECSEHSLAALKNKNKRGAFNSLIGHSSQCLGNKFFCTEMEQHFEMLAGNSVSAWSHHLSTNAQQAFNMHAGWQSHICFKKYFLHHTVMVERRKIKYFTAATSITHNERH
jgi:hypothetical protein